MNFNYFYDTNPSSASIIQYWLLLPWPLLFAYVINVFHTFMTQNVHIRQFRTVFYVRVNFLDNEVNQRVVADLLNVPMVTTIYFGKQFQNPKTAGQINLRYEVQNLMFEGNEYTVSHA